MRKQLKLTDEETEAFQIHFPAIAEKWEELYNRALELQEKNKNQTLEAVELSDISSSFAELSKTARNTLERIRKYEKIGTKEFRINNKCPICRKIKKDQES